MALLGKRLQVNDSGAEVSASFQTLAVPELGRSLPQLLAEITGQGSFDIREVRKISREEFW